MQLVFCIFYYQYIDTRIARTNHFIYLNVHLLNKIFKIFLIPGRGNDGVMELCSSGVMEYMYRLWGKRYSRCIMQG